MKREKKAIVAIAAIAAIIILSIIAYPFMAEMIAGENYHTAKITPVQNEHSIIYDISGDKMLYRCSGTTDIFLSDLDGRDKKGVDYSAYFHAVLNEEGDRFALYKSANSKLEIYNTTDRNENEQISLESMQGTSIKDIAWSPGGEKIALVISDTPNSSYHLYTYELASGEAKYVFSSPEYFNAPSWSPDEKYISFIAYADRKSTESTMFVADLKNSNVSASALKIKGDGRAYNPERSDWNPDPDKDEIAYSVAGAVGVCSPGGDNLRLFECYDDNPVCLHLEWSPNGDKILYEFYQFSGRAERERIGYIDVGTGEVKEILSSSFEYGYSVSWADDGKKIAYIQKDGGYDNGYLVDLNNPTENDLPVAVSYVLFFVLPLCLIAGWFFMKGSGKR
jgi:WD40 repeat protein